MSKIRVLVLNERGHLTYKDQQDPHKDLQDERDADESEEGDVEGETRAQLHNGLQLRGVGHQERYVQHALRCALLIGVMVHVDGGVSGDAVWPRRLNITMKSHT